MRKITFLLLVLLCFISLVSCDTATDTKIEEYTGTPLRTLEYESVSYFGGYTETYTVDFVENAVNLRTYMPYDGEEPEYSTLATFSDEEERELVNRLYTYGLFDIAYDYPSPPDILDGGGWDLSIEYTDGSRMNSHGSNNSPEVFGECAKAFYDLCGDGIVGYVPTSYYTPPKLSYSLCTSSGSMSLFSFGERVDYKWNGFESENNSIYTASQSADFGISLHTGREYTLVLYTSNWGDYDRFKRCTVTSYDYNEELSGEDVIHRGRWFKQIELDLELNKIYVVRLEFKNGDYVEYTFNTNTSPDE